MKTTIRMPEKIFADLYAHLFPNESSGLEEASFCYANIVATDAQMSLLVTEILKVPADAFVSQERAFLEIDQDFKVQAVLKARKQQQCLIEVHCHPHHFCDDSVEFSYVDIDGQHLFHNYLAWKLPSKPWAALVLGRNCAAGALWAPNATEGDSDVRLVIVGAEYREIPPSVTPFTEADARYDRQMLAFGAESQRRLGKVRLGIVGVGGLGSFIALQAAHMGFKDITVVEDQRLDQTNLNRWVTGGPSDVNEHKADVMRMRMMAIASDCKVKVVRDSLQSDEAINALVHCDAIIGTVDNDGARLVLSELACAHLIPNFDASSDVLPPAEDTPVRPGGRIHAWWPEQPCLLCSGELDRHDIRRSLARKTEREIAERMGYGGGTKLNSPSVIHLNGVIASVLMGELHAWATGYRAPIPYQKFYGWRGMLRPCASQEVRACPICKTIGKGEAANVRRYVVESDQKALTTA